MASKTKANGHLKLKKIYTRRRKQLAHATAAISTAASDAKERILDVEETVQKYAKANPWKAMGMSVLAGVIVAQILNLRK